MRPVVFIACGLLIGLCNAQSKLSARKGVEQALARHNQALIDKDIKGIQAGMAPGFAITDDKGKVWHATQVIAELTRLFKVATKIGATSKIQSFRMENGNAHIVSRGILDFDLPAQAGKASRTHSDTTSEEVWVPIGGIFKIKSAKSLTHKVTLNGKPVPSH
jgi:hypothetical protein